LIDLHTHTYESDGTYSPRELVEAAIEAGLEALAISDHDTFSGYDQAVPLTRDAGLDLVCGIELSTKHAFEATSKSKSVHLLAYFFNGGPPADFREWLVEMQNNRRDRNRRLAARLRDFGLDITLEEVEALGRTMTGRPHFARVLLEKGYVSSYDEAFRLYLDESAKAYVDRIQPALLDAIQRIKNFGGISSLAHPVRLGRQDVQKEEAFVALLRDAGLVAIEVWHSDHTEEDIRRYRGLAEKYGLAVTGGSDFHGAVKPSVRLGVGRGQVATPKEALDRLRQISG